MKTQVIKDLLSSKMIMNSLRGTNVSCMVNIMDSMESRTDCNFSKNMFTAIIKSDSKTKIAYINLCIEFLNNGNDPLDEFLLIDFYIRDCNTANDKELDKAISLYLDAKRSYNKVMKLLDFDENPKLIKMYNSVYHI